MPGLLFLGIDQCCGLPKMWLSGPPRGDQPTVQPLWAERRRVQRLLRDMQRTSVRRSTSANRYRRFPKMADSEEVPPLRHLVESSTGQNGYSDWLLDRHRDTDLHLRSAMDRFPIVFPTPPRSRRPDPSILALPSLRLRKTPEEEKLAAIGISPKGNTPGHFRPPPSAWSLQRSDSDPIPAPANLGKHSPYRIAASVLQESRAPSKSNKRQAR